MQQNKGAISIEDQEKARIIVSLYDAAEAFGDAMTSVQSDQERELIVEEYRARVAAVKKRLANFSQPSEEGGEFADSFTRAASYLDDGIE
jgi:hypothetical protein